MDKISNIGIGTIVKLYVVVDVFWAMIFATFGSVLASQGLSLIGSGTAVATIGGAGAWISTFFAALFVGAIILFVFTIFGAVLIAVGLFFSKNDPQMQRLFEKCALLYLGIDLVWAVLVATFFSKALAYFGLYIGAAVSATTLGAFLLWIIGFITAAAVGAEFLVMGTFLIAAGFFVYSLCRMK